MQAGAHRTTRLCRRGACPPVAVAAQFPARRELRLQPAQQLRLGDGHLRGDHAGQAGELSRRRPAFCGREAPLLVLDGRAARAPLAHVRNKVVVDRAGGAAALGGDGVDRHALDEGGVHCQLRVVSSDGDIAVEDRASARWRRLGEAREDQGGERDGVGSRRVHLGQPAAKGWRRARVTTRRNKLVDVDLRGGGSCSPVASEVGRVGGGRPLAQLRPPAAPMESHAAATGGSGSPGSPTGTPPAGPARCLGVSASRSAYLLSDKVLWQRQEALASAPRDEPPRERDCTATTSAGRPLAEQLGALLTRLARTRRGVRGRPLPHSRA